MGAIMRFQKKEFTKFALAKAGSTRNILEKTVQENRAQS